MQMGPNKPKTPEEEPVLKLEYTSQTVPYAADDVFWMAIVTANWTGIAEIDFDHLLVTYVDSSSGWPDRAVTIEVHPITNDSSLLRVHVHERPGSTHEHMKRDLLFESRLVETIASAGSWNSEHWANLNLSPEYVLKTRTLQFGIEPPEVDLFVNGIRVPHDNGEAHLNVAPGYFLTELRKEREGEQESPWREPDFASAIYHAYVDRLPSLYLFALTLAPPQAPPRPRRLPSAPPKPPPGIRGAVGAVGRTLLGRVLVVVGAIEGAIALAELVKEVIRLIDVHIDIQQAQGKCCCAWTRMETGIVWGLHTMDDGTQVSGTFLESWQRRIVRTVPVNPAGWCVSGLAPTFGQVRVNAQGPHELQGAPIWLLGGAGKFRGCVKGVDCGPQREVVQSYMDWNFIPD